MITHIDHLVLTVRDIGRAAEFYARVLKMEVVTFGEERRAHLGAEGIEILEGPVEKSGAQGPIISVYFNDPDGNLVEVSKYR